MRAVVLVSILFISPGVFPAPDEEMLGKSQGYPVCKGERGSLLTQSCLVGMLSNFDQAFPGRKVVKGAVPRPLKRAAQEPPIAYTHQGRRGSIDSFLAGNRNTGLLVIKDGTILAERYQYDRKPEHRFQSFSMAKTVVALLVGIAVHEGLIKSIDDKAVQYVPALKGHPYGETSLRHLLTMSSGVSFREDYDGKDDSIVLSRKALYGDGPGGVDSVLPFKERAHPAGTKFYYASAETQVLGLVLRAASGKPLAEYLSEKIWQPMGAEADATWIVDGGGHELGYMGLNATLRDWGRLGVLLADDGAWDGKQIVPAAWVKAMTTPDAPHLAYGTAGQFTGYGYQTWLLHPVQRFFALYGVRGQAVFVDPKTKLVIVHTAVHADFRDAARIEQVFFFYGALISLL